MTENKLPHTIKPKIFNRGFMIMILIIIIFTVMIILEGEVLIALINLITFGLIMLCVMLYFYRTIIVELDTFKYRGG